MADPVWLSCPVYVPLWKDVLPILFDVSWTKEDAEKQVRLFVERHPNDCEVEDFSIEAINLVDLHKEIEEAYSKKGISLLNRNFVYEAFGNNFSFVEHFVWMLLVSEVNMLWWVMRFLEDPVAMEKFAKKLQGNYESFQKNLEYFEKRYNSANTAQA